MEESNIRLRLFEGILKNSSETLHLELLESQCIQRIPEFLLKCDLEFDVSYYRSNYKFLPFRNFLPFRSEAICMISVIFWNKEVNPRIYSELMNEFIKAGSFDREAEFVKQKESKLHKLTAIGFFARLIRDGNEQILYILVRL